MQGHAALAPAFWEAALAPAFWEKERNGGPGGGLENASLLPHGDDAGT